MTISTGGQASLQDLLITRQLPLWLRTLKPAQLVTLNQYLGQQMEAEQQVRELYSDIKGLDEFAAPLVQKKLHDGHRLAVDVSKAQIRFKVTLPSALAALSGKPVERFFQHSLLQAALHNFSADEAQSMPGAQILDAGGQPEPLAPEAFAGICRALDIGKQYQDYLKQHLMAPGATGAEARRRIEEGFRSTLAATVQLAYLKGELQEQIFQSFMTMVAADQAHSGSQRELPVLVAKSWRVLGKQIRGAMAFEVRRDEHPDAPLQGVVCWIPGDEQGALSWYESWDVLFATLGKQLRLPGYDRFFQRFIGERDRIAFTQALAKAAARRAPHLPVELDGRYESINLTVFAHMRQVQIDTLLDNALLLAPPTADRDTQERDQRLHFYRRRAGHLGASQPVRALARRAVACRDGL
ncbi:DUF6543 domain-containing protein [Pseudomonas sp. TWI628]|uniref:dermonecrotic toxin domain-containing protein n=1 Tax=Pseudomonas sp. TWI628 TaxID=3136788 RepID=UPI003207E1EC